MYKYNFKFKEDVKLVSARYRNSSASDNYGQLETVTSDKIDGITSNVDSEGFGKEFAIEYNFAKFLLIDEHDGMLYIKGDFAVLTFVDRAGNEIKVDVADDAPITLSILK